jgi:hypothetical protein
MGPCEEEKQGDFEIEMGQSEMGANAVKCGQMRGGKNEEEKRTNANRLKKNTEGIPGELNGAHGTGRGLGNGRERALWRSYAEIT